MKITRINYRWVGEKFSKINNKVFNRMNKLNNNNKSNRVERTNKLEGVVMEVL